VETPRRSVACFKELSKRTFWTPTSPKAGDMGHPRLLWSLLLKTWQAVVLVSHVSNRGRHGAPDVCSDAYFRRSEVPSALISRIDCAPKCGNCLQTIALKSRGVEP